MLKDIIIRWAFNGGKSDKKNIIVVNKYDFPDLVELTKDRNDIAYISIEHSDNCLKYLLNDKKEHYLASSDNVLNVDFDDITEDFDYEPPLGHWFYAINEKQAKDIVDFIENNLDKNFIIHCRAGKSRSQGICRFILDMYKDKYNTCAANLVNPCIYPNGKVVRELKKEYYKKYNCFDINNQK